MSRSRAPGTRPPPTLWPLLLPLLSLLLFPAVWGDCGPPPEMPNATPSLEGRTNFSVDDHVYYTCNHGFQLIPDKQFTTTCLENGSWIFLETFCNKSCDDPPVVSFAAPKKKYISVNYFPIGIVVEYECRPGHRRVSPIPPTSTCRPNLEWTEVNEACAKKPCPNPGELANGHIDTTEGILFGSKITFLCDEGYRLIGQSFSYCVLAENTLEWSSELPTCTVIHCQDPPKIDNGEIRGASDSYVYRHSVTYVCAKGFVLVGSSSIYCTVKNDSGEWSEPPPKCIEKSKVPTTTQKSTTVHVPSTKVPLTPQRPTTVKAPVTSRAPTTKVTVHPSTRTTKEKEKSTSGGDNLIYGRTCLITLTVLHAMLLLIG